MPRPNFDGVPLFKSSKDQSIIGAGHDKDLDYEPMSPEHSKTFLSPRQDICSI